MKALVTLLLLGWLGLAWCCSPKPGGSRSGGGGGTGAFQAGAHSGGGDGPPYSCTPYQCGPMGSATNIARSGVASQSSEYKGALPVTGDSNKAIDGVKDLNWYNGFCSHTNADRDSWWRLDLKKKYKVDVVVVYGRSDCCLERMKDLEVRIGNSPDNNNPVCGKLSSVSSATTTFCCKGMEGQYVNVVIPGRSEYMHLCEVEVYGDPVTEENTLCW